MFSVNRYDISEWHSLASKQSWLAMGQVGA